MAENEKKPKVCRNLMLELEESDGDRMRDESERWKLRQNETMDMENEINELLSSNLDSKMRKWNFDFVNDVPLPGDWEWQPCQNGEEDRQRQPTAN